MIHTKASALQGNISSRDTFPMPAERVWLLAETPYLAPWQKAVNARRRGHRDILYQNFCVLRVSLQGPHMDKTYSSDNIQQNVYSCPLFCFLHLDCDIFYALNDAKAINMRERRQVVEYESWVLLASPDTHCLQHHFPTRKLHPLTMINIKKSSIIHHFQIYQYYGCGFISPHIYQNFWPEVNNRFLISFWKSIIPSDSMEGQQHSLEDSKVA